MKIVPRMLAGIVLAAFLFPVSAQELPEIVVTGTRTPLGAEQLPAASTVFTREDIERLQVKTLPELLRGVAGIDITESGGFGKLTGVFIRGAEADQVLVLIDGIRVGAVTAGTTAFQDLPVEMFERVEIIRGPRASQWGSEAIGGVIQLFTRKGSGPLQYSLNAGHGSFDTYKAWGGMSGEAGSTNYALTGAYFDSDGFDARQPIPGEFGFSQPDDDGYDNGVAQARVGHSFDNGIDLDAFVLRAEGTTEFDGLFEDKTDLVQQVAGGSLSFVAGDVWDGILRIGESRDETDNFAPDGSFSSRFDTIRRQASLQNNFSLTDNQVITLGVDYRDDEVDSDAQFSETSRDNTGVFAQYLGNFAGHQLLGALRHDDNEAFSGETTGGAGWSYLWDSGVRIYASYGTAFKAPSFNELFFPFFGNPNLKAETSDSYELGFEGRHDWGAWGFRGYQTQIDDLIVTVSDAATGSFFPDNVGRAQIDGLELEVSGALAGWDTALALSFVDPENRETGRRLRRRAKKTIAFDLSRAFDFPHPFGNLIVSTRVLSQGDRFEDADNANRLGGYTTVDLLGEYHFNEHFAVKAKAGNLFDEEYETADTFNSAEANIFVSLHYKNR